MAPSADDFADAADYRRLFPDGRIGSNPSLANPADGKRLFDAAVADIAEEFKRFRTAA